MRDQVDSKVQAETIQKEKDHRIDLCNIENTKIELNEQRKYEISKKAKIENELKEGLKAQAREKKLREKYSKLNYK